MTRRDDLRSRRERLDLSREALAHLAGCSGAMVALLENGYRPVRSMALERITAALDDLEREHAA